MPASHPINSTEAPKHTDLQTSFGQNHGEIIIQLTAIKTQWTTTPLTVIMIITLTTLFNGITAT